MGRQAKELQRLRKVLETSADINTPHPLALEGKSGTAISFNVDALAARNKER